jgi:hypothetical protein
VSRTEPSVTRPPTSSCFRRRNLMSPPTDSHGPTDEMQMTLLGLACSKASYSGESIPAGLSAAMSGRWGTMRTVTARPAIFMPGPSGLPPGTWRQHHRLFCSCRLVESPMRVTWGETAYRRAADQLTGALRASVSSFGKIVTCCTKENYRAPSIMAGGHPITHRPSTRACS